MWVYTNIFMGSQRVGHDWATDLIWSDIQTYMYIFTYTWWNHIYNINALRFSFLDRNESKLSILCYWLRKTNFYFLVVKYIAEILLTCVCVLSCFSCVPRFVIPRTIARQAPLSMEFSKQVYWGGLPCPPSEDLPDPGIESESLSSPALAGEFFTTDATWEAQLTYSVQFSHSVVSDSLQPHESQHDRPPCPSPTPRVHSDSHPSSRWCHPSISSSVVPFSSCPQSLPASGSFPMSQLFAWDGQSIGASASASVLPMNTQDWSCLEWTGWTSLQSKGLSRVFSNTTVQKHQFFSAQLSSQSNSNIHTWPLEKT